MDFKIERPARDWIMEQGGDMTIYTPMFGGG